MMRVIRIVYKTEQNKKPESEILTVQQFPIWLSQLTKTWSVTILEAQIHDVYTENEE